jgi:hypothetical protein
MRNGETQFEILAFLRSIGVCTTEDGANETIDSSWTGEYTYICTANCPSKHNSMDGKRIDKRKSLDVERAKVNGNEDQSSEFEEQ